MVRDSDQTKGRLLAAAMAEFAEYGIAGARIDRIANAARTNKQMIYAYFGNKDGLFDTVFTEHVARWLAAVDFDVGDLPGYAGRLFDYFEADPAALRLSTWYRLERPAGPGLKAVIEVNDLRLARLARARRDGRLPSRFEPVQLLALIQAMATSWATMNPEFSAASAGDRDYRRATVVSAVARLLDPAVPDPAVPDPAVPIRRAGA
ncbi:MAG: TetR family transcriptional regulator [Kibdelosporangium sp.]